MRRPVRRACILGHHITLHSDPEAHEAVAVDLHHIMQDFVAEIYSQYNIALSMIEVVGSNGATRV